MARNARPPPQLDRPDPADESASNLDAHMMVRMPKHAKALLVEQARSAGVKPATLARIHIIRGLNRKRK